MSSSPKAFNINLKTNKQYRIKYASLLCQQMSSNGSTAKLPQVISTKQYLRSVQFPGEFYNPHLSAHSQDVQKRINFSFLNRYEVKW